MSLQHKDSVPSTFENARKKLLRKTAVDTNATSTVVFCSISRLCSWASWRKSAQLMLAQVRTAHVGASQHSLGKHDSSALLAQLFSALSTKKPGGGKFKALWRRQNMPLTK
jgi:hypothetical protein